MSEGLYGPWLTVPGVRGVGAFAARDLAVRPAPASVAHACFSLPGYSAWRYTDGVLLPLPMMQARTGCLILIGVPRRFI